MSTGIKRPYEQVLPIAQRVMDGLTPSCSWIQLAGSLRRQKAMIGDVEIVAVCTDGRLYEALDARLADGKIAHLPKKRWGQKLRSFLYADIQFDLFIQPDPQTLGVNFLIRTGSAEFSHKMVTKRSLGGWMPDCYTVKDARVWQGETALHTPNELDVFALWGMAYVEPQQRTDEYTPTLAPIVAPEKPKPVIVERAIYLPDTLPSYPGRDGTREGAALAARQAIAQSLALQKRNKLAPPTKRSVAGIDAEAGEDASGPMFEQVDD